MLNFGRVWCVVCSYFFYNSMFLFYFEHVYHNRYIHTIHVQCENSGAFVRRSSMHVYFLCVSEWVTLRYTGFSIKHFCFEIWEAAQCLRSLHDTAIFTIWLDYVYQNSEKTGSRWTYFSIFKMWFPKEPGGSGCHAPHARHVCADAYPLGIKIMLAVEKTSSQTGLPGV